MSRLLVTFLLFSFSSVNAQVFSSAKVLKNHQLTFSLNPLLINDLLADDAGMFLHGEYGIGGDMEVTTKLSLGLNKTYFGVAIEKTIIRSFPIVSISGGIHSFDDIGLDFSFNLSGSVNKLVNLYGGFDTDFVFAEKREWDIKADKWRKESDLKFLSWIFFGSEVVIGKRLTLLFEAEIGAADEAYNLFGTGLKYYF